MRKWALLAVGLAVILAGWRPAPREPEGMALVRVLGVDGAGPVTLTAVCGGDDQENQSRGRCAGRDFGQALEGLPWSGEEELSLTSVSYLVVGRDVDLKQTLLAVLRNRELGASASVWLAEEGAGALLDGCGDPAGRLDLLTRQGVEAPTAVRALAALERGKALVLPLLDGTGPELIDWEEWRRAA